ncbi:MAG: hypothetical protein V3V08_00120 [Nannocystaceae bacterium]
MLLPKRTAISPLPPVLMGLLGCLACHAEQPAAVPLDASVPARRAAQAFVHCVEQDGAHCVDWAASQGAWDAFSLLGWLESGSPMAILRAFSRELDHHRDIRSVEARFMAQVQTYAPVLRGAGCETTKMLPTGDLVGPLRAGAQQRLTTLGLWTDEVGEVVAGLAQEASDGLGDGYLTRLDCPEDPWRFYVATAQDGGRYAVVGLVAALPRFLGGEGQDREVSDRVRSRVLGGSSAVAAGEGTLHPWLPLPVEEI